MNISRRNALKKMGLLAGSAALPGLATDSISKEIKKTEGQIKQSVCKWCYADIPLDKFSAAVKKIGLKSVELLGPDDWSTLKKHGLTCAMPNGAEIGLTRGFNDPQYHDQLAENYNKIIPMVAEADFDKIICFSGNRNGMDDEVGLENCVTGLKKILSTAEKHGVTVCMELLNSKVDHPDYMCDHTNWGVELVKKVGSDNFKLLYDIYHMQIMEGDVIRTIRDNKDYIAHYHTGGVPGRNEIDETQELYYPAIMQAIVDTGFEGFVAQEFVPSWDDKIKALQQGYDICNI
jgi:hydroxypyruvate isomerase